MNHQFDTLPFAMEGELDDERGARGLDSVRSLASRSSPRGGGRIGAARQSSPGHGPGRIVRGAAARGAPRKQWPQWPYYGPHAGGWWPATQVTVFPYDAGDDALHEPDAVGEIPHTIAATLGRLPVAQRPPYVALGSLTSALRDPRATGAGFYLIEFTVNGVQRAYSGQTGNLRRRLQQHALCGQMMGLPLAAHAVYVAQSGLPEAQRRALERRIHDDMFRTSAGVLTNQRRELEAELFGNEWR